LSQYHPQVRAQFENVQTCPEEYLLWFHHVPWNHQMKSGNKLWEELVAHYYIGVDSVRQMQKTWDSLKGKIDNDRFEQVQQLLKVQEKEAKMWRNACVLYFQTFSKLPIPPNYEKPDQTLEYYENLNFRFVPGI
jgi:alpha-glucuronidase